MLQAVQDAGVPGPPPHVHHNYDQAWYLVEGTMESLLGGQTHLYPVGSIAFAPRGTPHSFMNRGPEPARIVAITTATALPLIKELGVLAAGGPPDPIARRSLLDRHETHLVGHVDSRSPSPDG